MARKSGTGMKASVNSSVRFQYDSRRQVVMATMPSSAAPAKITCPVRLVSVAVNVSRANCSAPLIVGSPLAPAGSLPEVNSHQL